MAQIDKLRLSGVVYDIIDATAIHSLEGYATTGDVTAATAAVAETVARQHYQTSGDVQNAISGKADTTAVETALSGKYGDVEYDSNTKRINFYADSTTGTVLSYIDASAFVKDAFLDTVEVQTIDGTPYLVFTWNTDAGKEVTQIPFGEVFNPDNYWTSAQTQSAITQATSGKVETSVYNSYTAATDTAISGKQATLVSGTNIKTINNTSLLGSGDISTLQASISGTTLVLS